MTPEEEARKEVEENLFQEPPTEAPKEKTKTDKFTDLLNGCPDLETAKAKIGEFADLLKCKKALGYKALKKTRFVLEAPKTPKAEVPTVKISEAPTTEIITEELQEPALPPSLQAPFAPTEAVAIAPTPEAPPTPITEKLAPIFERSMQRLLNNGMEALTGAKDLLDTQEAKDTATLMPLLIYRLTKVTLTDEQFIDVTIVTHFGSIVVKVINKRRQASKEKIVKPPTPEKPPETPRPVEKSPTEQQIAESKKNQTPSFLKHLS